MSIKRLATSELQLVPYRGNFLENEFNRIKEALLYKIFREELCLYPIQQQFWKKQIRLLIEPNYLSCKAFHAIFPKIVKITEQKKTINLIFSLFRQFAEKPSEEICGRFFWSFYKATYPQHFSRKQLYLDNSICMITCDALASSIFGIDYIKKMQELSFDMTQKGCSLDNAWSTIEKNSKALSEKAPSTFCVYTFAMTKPPSSSSFPGHTFVVIQHLDKHTEVQYRIYQSFVKQYPLKDCLKKDNHQLDQAKFIIFLKGLENCLTSNKWTQVLETFYTSYFNAKRGFYVGCNNPCRGTFSLRWRMGNIEDILEQNEKFKTFQNSPDFPQIEAEYL